MTRPLTDKQMDLLYFLAAFEAENDAFPTTRTIAKHFGNASENAPFEQLRQLAKKGFIERNAQGGWRFTRAKAEAADV